MVATVSRKKKVAGDSPVAVAPAPQRAQVRSVPKKAEAEASIKRGSKQDFVMLGNDCRRYHVDGKLYVSGTQYPVTPAQRAALFAHTDDKGVPYFYDAEHVLRQIRAQQERVRKQANIEAGVEENDVRVEGGGRGAEIDTGAMKLEDESGEAVGTRGTEGGEGVTV